MPHLADIWSLLNPSVIGWVVLSIIAALIGWAALMAALNGTRQFREHKAPSETEIAKQSQAYEELRDRLKGLAPAETVEELVKSMGTFATRAELKAVEQILPTFLTRREFEEKLQLFDAHFADFAKEWRAELRTMRTESDSAREGLHRRIESLVKATFEVRGILIGLGKQEGTP